MMDLVQAKRHLDIADLRYAEHRTQANHLHVCYAQQVYYPLALRQIRATWPKHLTTAECARILLYRAYQNRKREKDNPEWQEMALHQVQRARSIYQRARVLAELDDPTPKRKPYKPRGEYRPKLKRVSSPITRRWVYVYE